MNTTKNNKPFDYRKGYILLAIGLIVLVVFLVNVWSNPRGKSLVEEYPLGVDTTYADTAQ